MGYDGDMKIFTTVLMAILGLIVFGFLYYLGVSSLRCKDFKVQADAQLFYYIGARQLDGRDKDGQACEHLAVPRPGTAYL